MTMFLSFICTISLVLAIVFGISAFKKKNRGALPIFAVCVAVCIVSALLVPDKDEKMGNQPVTENIPSAIESVSSGPEMSAPESAEPTEEDNIKAAVTESLSSAYQSEQVKQVSVKENEVEASIWPGIPASETAPDNWTELKTAAVAAQGEMAVALNGQRESSTLYLYNDESKIVLAVENGEVIHDIYAPPKQAPSPTPIPSSPDSSGSGATSTSHSYVLNINTMKFHYPSCSSVEDISENNKQNYFGDRKTLLSQGYSPCAKCNP